MKVKKKSEFAKYPVEDKTILIIGYIILGLFICAIILPMVYIILASFIDPVTLQNRPPRPINVFWRTARSGWASATPCCTPCSSPSSPWW